MSGDISWITNFIWGIADDVLRDLYVRGKYRDVILPMTVLRRLDAVLEPTSAAVVEMRRTLEEQGVVNQDGALRLAAGQSLYNTSAFTMRDLQARTSQQQLRADFEAYLDGFSPNVQEILDSFEFRHQIPRLSRADALGTLIEKFADPAIDLSPSPDTGIDNHAMGSIFEELVRRFNEENNEEAGEHWTPRDAVRLMANLVFLPIADEIESGTYLVYDGACGTGGMLTVAEETLEQLATQAWLDAKEWADLSKPLPSQAVVRHGLGDDGPILGRVAADAEVGQFVGDDVVEEGGRGHNRPPVEAKRPVGGAARPAPSLVPDEDFLRLDTEMTRDAVDPRGQLHRRSLSVPCFEGGAHPLQTLLAPE